jgi:outer membrane immunogenic protein
MKMMIAALAALALPTTALAQEADTAEAPDGSRAFGIEPYVGIGGGWHDFNTGNKGVLEQQGSLSSGIVTGFAGVNVPLGPLVVGAEGNVAKGTDDIDWEYGVSGHVGVRVGESGMFFARAGYQWIESDLGDDRNEMYGFGVEVGPKDIGLGGITGESGVRLRLAFDTFDVFQSIRPTAAVVFHF